MKSCPETDKIRKLIAGDLTEKEVSSLREHAEKCPSCRQELRIETDIDRELTRQYTAPEIEGSVIRALKIMELAEAGGRRGDYKYFLCAALILVFGPLVAPYLLHIPTDWISRFVSAERLRPLVDAFRSNLPLVIGVGTGLMTVSLIFSFPRLRKAFEL